MGRQGQGWWKGKVAVHVVGNWRCTFVAVIREEGDVTLDSACAKLEAKLDAKSKDSSSTSNMRRFFPHARLANHNLAIVGEE